MKSSRLAKKPIRGRDPHPAREAMSSLRKKNWLLGTIKKRSRQGVRRNTIAPRPCRKSDDVAAWEFRKMGSPIYLDRKDLLGIISRVLCYIYATKRFLPCINWCTILQEHILKGAALAGARAPVLNRAIGFGQPNLGIKPRFPFVVIVDHTGYVP
jgi:hypothetical protein